jgi:hypothetical protein
MTNNIPAWERIAPGEPAPTVAFALILDGIVQQVMSTNTSTASLLLENPQIVRCNYDTVVGMTAEEATFVATP